MNQSLPEGRKHVLASLQPKQIYPFQTATFPASLAFSLSEKRQSESAAISPEACCFCAATEREAALRDRALVESGAILVPEDGKKAKRRRWAMRGRQGSVPLACRVKHSCFTSSVRDQYVQSKPRPTLTLASQITPDPKPSQSQYSLKCRNP